MTDPNPPPPAKERRSFKRRILWALLLVLVIYPLSTGPVLRLCIEYNIQSPLVWDFYAPIGYVTKYCDPAKKFIEWYIFDLWDVRFPFIK